MQITSGDDGPEGQHKSDEFTQSWKKYTCAILCVFLCTDGGDAPEFRFGRHGLVVGLGHAALGSFDGGRGTPAGNKCNVQVSLCIL